MRGSLFQITISASLPGAMTPTSLSRPISSALRLVLARTASIGVMPKARVLLLIGRAGTTSGLNIVAWYPRSVSRGSLMLSGASNCSDQAPAYDVVFGDHS